MAKKSSKKELSLEEKLENALVPVEEQPYAVPENWVWVRLGSIFRWGSGGTPSRKNPDFYTGEILWIKTGELLGDYIFDSEEKITDEAVSKSSAKLFPNDTVILAMYGATIGKVAILGREATTNQACACAPPNNKTSVKYLFYFLSSQKENFIKKGKGGAQPNISQEIIKNHTFPLPPLAEQERIVSRIESLFSKLDEAKELIENSLNRLEHRKSAILHKAFSGELTKQWREENGVGFEWEDVSLSDVLDVRDGTHDSPVYQDSGYPLVTSKNLKNDVINLKNVKYITEIDYNLINARSKVDINDILFAMIGTIGNPVVITTEPKYAIKNVALFKDIKKIDSFFVKHYLDSSFVTEKMKKEAKGSTQKFVSLGYLRKFPIILPTLPEQEEIVRILDDLLGKEQESKELLNLLEKIDLMKKAILGRAFRGELGTNRAEEESAEGLLREVLGEGK